MTVESSARGSDERESSAQLLATWSAMVAAAVPEVARSPLGHRAVQFAELGADTRGAVGLAELPFMTMLDLRLDPAHADVVGPMLEFPLPGPNRAGGPGPYGAIWLGPDEWLVTAPPGDTGLETRLQEALTAALPEGVWPASIVDVSANRTALWLSGPRAGDVLAKLCALDLHPRVTTVPRDRGTPRSGYTWWSAVTLVAGVNVILVDSGGDWMLLVRPSFADHLADHLLDAATEFTA